MSYYIIYNIQHDRQGLSEALLVQGEMREHEHRQYEEHYAANERRQRRAAGAVGGGGGGMMMTTNEGGGDGLHYGSHRDGDNGNNDFAWANDDLSSMRRP